jgi:DNA polymerase III subunit epsilon
VKTIFDKKSILALPLTYGVYLFYGAEDVLLYVGKSKTIRSRVRAHFAHRDERWLVKRIRRIEARETAGELGSLLLESQLIKELHPLYNIRSRQPRRIIIARRVDNERGYATVKLEAVDYLDLQPEKPILGIFKHKTQAKDFLNAVSKTHKLCSKLLRLEQSHGYCFPYHLGHCGGACMGEEDIAAYNARVEAAFEARRIISWPFEGPVTIEEISKDKKMREEFIVDNWCLIAGTTSDGEKKKHLVLSSPRRFDYDSYKILYSYIMEERNKVRIRIPLPHKGKDGVQIQERDSGASY